MAVAPLATTATILAGMLMGFFLPVWALLGFLLVTLAAMAALAIQSGAGLLAGLVDFAVAAAILEAGYLVGALIDQALRRRATKPRLRGHDLVRRGPREPDA